MYSRNISGLIPRLLAVLESLGSNDIAHAVSGEQGSTRELFLGVSGDVARDNCQAHAKSKTLEVTQPQRNQASPGGTVWQTNKHRGASNTNEVGNHHGGATRVGPFAANETASEESSKLHETTGDLQVLGTKSVEAEVLDDQRSETCDGGVGNLSGHSQNEENPSLGVGNSLPGLVDLEVVVLDTLSVGSNSLDGDGALSLVKEPCR